MDHSAAFAQRARQGRNGHRNAAPARRDAKRLEERERGVVEAAQEAADGHIGRARTKRKAGAAKRARRGGIEPATMMRCAMP